MASKDISNKNKRMVKLISDFCIMNHSANFCCELRMPGYVNWIDVTLSSGGDSNPIDTFEANYLSFDSDDDYNSLMRAYKDMVDFKRNHDEHFSIERQLEIKEKNRIEKIKRLKIQLEEMENQ